jgi:phage antirepressor YoqD-like protein
MAPDLRRKVDAARAARLAREAESKKQVEAQVSKIEVRLCLAGPLIAFVFFFCSAAIQTSIGEQAEATKPIWATK